MKIMWLTAMKHELIFPVGTGRVLYGGWLSTMLARLSEHHSVTEVTVVSVGVDFADRQINDKLRLICVKSKSGVFSYDKGLSKRIGQVIKMSQPDVIDVQGAEFFIGTSLTELKLSIPITLTLQGFTSEIYKYLSHGLSLTDLFLRRSLRDYVLRDGILERRFAYRKRGENESRLLSEIKYFIGRTSWDEGLVRNVNPCAKYFHCGRIMRSDFYNSNWSLNGCKRYTIHITQANYSLKGLHVALDALVIVKKHFPEVKLTVSGKDLLKLDSLKDKISVSGYQKIIRTKIRDLSLVESVRFTGELAAGDLVNTLKSSHVFLLPSLNENSPNALGEAQLVGVPCIASFVGGVPDYIADGISGLLYSSTDSARLASLIIKVFSNDLLACRIASKGKEQAEQRHNPDSCLKQLVTAYSDVVNDSFVS